MDEKVNRVARLAAARYALHNATVTVDEIPGIAGQCVSVWLPDADDPWLVYGPEDFDEALKLLDPKVER